jgi:hypothetical protein
MREQKNIEKPPKGGTQNSSLTVEVEAAPVHLPFETNSLAGQVFYILDRDLSEILKENRKAIWGDLLKKNGSFSDGARAQNIKEILSAPDNPRKYPAALICTADKLRQSDRHAKNSGDQIFYHRFSREGQNRRFEGGNLLCLRPG